MTAPKETGLSVKGEPGRTGQLKERMLANVTELSVGRRSFPWMETRDFPVTDPWSTHTRNAILVVRALPGIHGNYFEAGIGDGRNAVTAGVHENGARITGIDVDRWRLDVATENLTRVGVDASRLDLKHGDVVSYLQDLPQGERLTGWGVACLPQAPGAETHNHADGFDPHLPSLARVRGLTLDGHPVDEVGLTLNAAFLDVLRGRVDKGNFDLLLTVSDRVPPDIREELFGKTGWEIAEEYRTEVPVQQDPDTGVKFVEAFDDGKRFFQRTEEGLFAPISAREAEKRRAASDQNGGRESLNAYHHLSVYHLTPGARVVYAN